MENEANSEKKLNWREACAILGCKKSHFYNLINSGRIPAQRYGCLRGVWFYEKDCQNYLQSMKKLKTFLDGVYLNTYNAFSKGGDMRNPVR